MIQRLKQYSLIAIAAGIVYFLLSYHLLFEGLNVPTLLKKGKKTFNHTFVSLKTGEFAKPGDLLKIEALRDDGVGDVLVEKGYLTDAERSKLENKYAAEE